MEKAILKPPHTEKLFFKIGEVCDLTDTQPYVLRFWESEFPQLAPQKNRSGQRIYRRNDIELILRIKKLLYEKEFTIAGARRQLESEQPERQATTSTKGEKLELGACVQEIRSELQNLLKLLDRPLPDVPPENE